MPASPEAALRSCAGRRLCSGIDLDSNNPATSIFGISIVFAKFSPSRPLSSELFVVVLVANSARFK